MTLSALEALDRAKGLDAIVIGDVMLDRRIVSVPTGISAEAPIPKLSLQDTVDQPGGAANAAAGLAAMGLRARVVGHVGVDDEGTALRTAASRVGVDLSGVVESTAAPTTVKTRITSGGHVIARVDREASAPAVEPTELAAAIDAGRPAVVLFSDYDKGTLTDETTPALLAICRRHGIPTIVDPKAANPARYVGATILTPNAAELEAMVGGGPLGPVDRLGAARRLLAEADASVVMVTLGQEGVLVVTDSEAVPVAADRRAVFDVTGAGDTFAAVVAAALAGGSDTLAAAVLANTAAGLSVTVPGTAIVDLARLSRAIRGPAPADAVSVTDAERHVVEWRERGLTVVATNGCFDLFHRGHLDLLRAARAEGDRLLVAVNDDGSVARLKGVGRPLVPLGDRVAMLAALRSVDLVVSFSTDTPAELYESIVPDVLVKGDDYELDDIVGAEVVLASGGRVVRVPRRRVLSTTDLIEHVRLTSSVAGVDTAAP